MRAIRGGLLVFGLMIALAACGGDSLDPPAVLRTIAITLAGGREITVEVAESGEERAHGLGDRDALAEDSGMIFAYPIPGRPVFWMKGMRFPLDVVWIDGDKRVVEVAAGIPAEPGVGDSGLKRYSPSRPVQYVLELNSGAAARLGIDAGDQLDFDVGGG
jgi:uncharacterized membrane protein (UPF0127 family)